MVVIPPIYEKTSMSSAPGSTLTNRVDLLLTRNREAQALLRTLCTDLDTMNIDDETKEKIRTRTAETIGQIVHDREELLDLLHQCELIEQWIERGVKLSEKHSRN